MKNVLLIHDDKMRLPHYRIRTYDYLHSYLKDRDYNLMVVANGIQKSYEDPVVFPLFSMKLGLKRLLGITHDHKPQACILVINHSKPYFFPFLLFLKAAKLKAITWTHGVDLQRKQSKLSKLAHHMEHALCDGIIIYADHMKIYIANRHCRKVFVANNTLNLTGYKPQHAERGNIMRKYGINTEKNVIFVGRIHTRKRIQDLLLAFEHLRDRKYGLIVVGPDEEGIMTKLLIKDPRIFNLGALYGNDVLDLLTACDVYCIPGAIGLSIVDAMYCGLPVVTERVDHGPEIMYLHDGVNGFLVEKGDWRALADRIHVLLEDEELRLRFSRKAREEIETNGHIDNLCKGVLQCLDYLIGTE